MLNFKYATMNKLKFYILFIVFFTLISCTEEIDLPLDTTYQRLVIEGGITTDTMAHAIILSKSSDPYGKAGYEYISDAVVNISDGDINFPLIEDPLNKGHYYTSSDVYGVPGKTYTLIVENIDIDNDGNTEKYTAVSKMPKPFRFDFIKIIPFSYSSSEKGHLVLAYGQVLESRSNFWMRIFKNNILITDSIFKLDIGTSIDTGYVAGDYAYYLDNNNERERIKEGDTIIAEMGAVTQEYRNYIRALKREYFPKSPIFSGPSANLPTNIQPSEKVVGFFYTSAITRVLTIYSQNSSKR